MVYRGYVRDGKIVMDEQTRLPEGAEVEMTVRETNGQERDDRPIEDVIAEYPPVFPIANGRSFRPISRISWTGRWSERCYN